MMMRLPLPDNNRKRKRKKVLIQSILIFLLLAILVLINTVNPNFFSAIAQSVARPVMIVRNATGEGIWNFFGSFRTKAAIINENNELKEKLATLQAVEAERDVYKQENLTLEGLMNRTPEATEQTVARILSKPGYSPFDTMIIDAGKSEGVSEGMIVLAGGGDALGKTSIVNGHTSTVIMYSSPGERTNVFIGETSIEAEAIGKGGGNFEVKLPINSGVAAGDIVVISANPRYVIGKVDLVNVTPADSFEQVLFKGLIDVSHISYVLVEK
jgi:cell shape-determining protein MreC